MSIVHAPSPRRGRNSRTPRHRESATQIRERALLAGIDPFIAATEDPRDLAAVIRMAPRLRLVDDVETSREFEYVMRLAPHEDDEAWPEASCPNLAFRSEGVREHIDPLAETNDERASTLTFVASLRARRDGATGALIEPHTIASAYAGDCA